MQYNLFFMRDIFDLGISSLAASVDLTTMLPFSFWPVLGTLGCCISTLHAGRRFEFFRTENCLKTVSVVGSHQREWSVVRKGQRNCPNLVNQQLLHNKMPGLLRNILLIHCVFNMLPKRLQFPHLKKRQNGLGLDWSWWRESISGQNRSHTNPYVVQLWILVGYNASAWYFNAPKLKVLDIRFDQICVSGTYCWPFFM